MLEQNAFLQAACRNVHALLDGVLRFEYASHIDEAVFLTLQKRILHLEESLRKADIQALAGIATDLAKVAEIVALAEKSHVGEFSWAFVHHFAELANKAWMHSPAASLTDGAKEADSPAQKKTAAKVAELNKVHFFFSSNSSLYNYLVYREKRGNDQGGAKIFNVQFPRAFKESVLLHGLLAHEIGHALIDINRDKWASIIEDTFAESPLKMGKGHDLNDEMAAPNDAATWVRSWTNPQTPVTRGNVGTISEEVFCDVIGLLLIGPAFIFALAQLLWAVQPIDQGKAQLPSYPPFRVRLTTLLDAARQLGWDKFIDGDAWSAIEPYGYENAGDGKQLFSIPQIQGLLSKLKAELPEEVRYPGPDRVAIEAVKKALLDRIPPGNTTLLKNNDEKIVLDAIGINFRDLLLAGWEVVATPQPKNSRIEESASWPAKFKQVNQLCEKGLANLIAAKSMSGVTS